MRLGGATTVNQPRGLCRSCGEVLGSREVGCAAKVGPRSLAHDRFDYSAAITQSWKEQMLLNMAKLRYMDPPMFLNMQQCHKSSNSAKCERHPYYMVWDVPSGIVGDRGREWP
jgi:hypothetical protein